VNDDIHIDFIQSASNILGLAFGFKYCTDREELRKVLKEIKVKEFIPGNVKINVNVNDNAGNIAEDDEQICARIV